MITMTLTKITMIMIVRIVTVVQFYKFLQSRDDRQQIISFISTRPWQIIYYSPVLLLLGKIRAFGCKKYAKSIKKKS